MGKTVIIGQQILDSMVQSDRPHRRDVQEISAVVVEGADCILLQAETSDGKHPEKSVLQLAKCCAEAEKTIEYRTLF
jgi:pyruvate kinase